MSAHTEEIRFSGASGNCDQAEFNRVCGMFPSGVTVVTTIDPAGTPRGVTLSSFTSVSMDPPMVLVCIDQRSQIMQSVTPNHRFGVNILSEEQRMLAVRFSRNWSERFIGVDWYAGKTGVPLLTDVVATLECRVAEMISAGDHIVVLGCVLHAAVADFPPLIYTNRRYGKVVT